MGGGTVTLLNPSEKGTKFADELRNGAKQTNDGFIKFNADGKPVKLTSTEASYRMGYLDAQKDSARAYNHNKKKGK